MTPKNTTDPITNPPRAAHISWARECGPGGERGALAAPFSNEDHRAIPVSSEAPKSRLWARECGPGGERGALAAPFSK
jgi:hypothetical protein